MSRTEVRVRRAVHANQELRTPSGRGRFRVAEIGPERLVLLLGAEEARTVFDWATIEGVAEFLKGRDWVEIAGTYSVTSTPGTLDWYLKQSVNRATAGWVAVVLEAAGIVEIDRTRPARVRLKDGE